MYQPLTIGISGDVGTPVRINNRELSQFDIVRYFLLRSIKESFCTRILNSVWYGFHNGETPRNHHVEICFVVTLALRCSSAESKSLRMLGDFL